MSYLTIAPRPSANDARQADRDLAHARDVLDARAYRQEKAAEEDLTAARAVLAKAKTRSGRPAAAAAHKPSAFGSAQLNTAARGRQQYAAMSLDQQIAHQIARSSQAYALLRKLSPNGQLPASMPLHTLGGIMAAAHVRHQLGSL